MRLIGESFQRIWNSLSTPVLFNHWCIISFNTKHNWSNIHQWKQKLSPPPLYKHKCFKPTAVISYRRIVLAYSAIYTVYLEIKRRLFFNQPTDPLILVSRTLMSQSILAKKMSVNLRGCQRIGRTCWGIWHLLKYQTATEKVMSWSLGLMASSTIVSPQKGRERKKPLLQRPWCCL